MTGRVKELDGLRALACFGVIQSHMGGFFAGGTLGVDVFLVLSAYLLATRLLREREQTGSVDVVHFYGRRIRRIWPLYFIVLGTAVLLSPRTEMPFLLPTAFFVSNFALAWTAQTPAFTGPMWSTGLEEQFYAVVPWFVRSRGALRRAGWALLALGFACRAASFSLTNHAYFWSWHVFRWDAFAAGLLLATETRLPALRAPARWGLILAGIALAVVASPFVQAIVFWSQPLMAVAAALIVFGGLTGRDALLGHRVLAWLGERTYGMYLFHLGLVMTLPWHLALVSTVALAALSYRFLERPILDYRRPDAPRVGLSRAQVDWPN